MTEAHESRRPANENRRGAATGAERKANSAALALDARLSGPLAPLENALDDLLGEKASYQLPTGFKDFLVKVAPWASLASGILGLLTAISLWRVGHYVNQMADYANQLSAMYGAPTRAGNLGVLFWISIVMILIFAALAFMAFPGLRARKKIGWNIMFYSMLASVLYSVVSLFYYGGGFGSFIGSLLAAIIGLYLLFQVRSRYTV